VITHCNNIIYESRLDHMEWRFCFLTLLLRGSVSEVGCFRNVSTRTAYNILCILCFQQRGSIRLKIKLFEGFLHFCYCLLFVFLALQPIVVLFLQPGSGLLPPPFRGFLITHNDAPQSVGLLWMSDQSIAETST
jgi:hypothetical protein